MMRALLKLRQNAYLSMRDVARALCCDPSYVTGLVDELTARGLASRQSAPEDRRVKTVVLTPEGARLAEQIQAVLSVPPASFSTLSRTEAKQLVALLERVVSD
jgi:DNA-binding MarR family transcriptional regulator